MKKLLVIGACLTLIVMSAPLELQAQTVTIAINEINANESINGRVLGLQGADYSDFKVVVYVKTDKWYIHPYAGQGEGSSWAPVNPDGTWEIGTVKRQFQASAVAAILIPKDQAEKPSVLALPEIHSRARVVRELTGTADYGKL
jgi:hypothetical protein